MAAQALPWLPLLAGLFAAGAVWLLSQLMGESGWTTVGRVLGPPGALGRALTPLLLSATVICGFAFQVLGWQLQLVAGVVLSAVIWLLVRGGGEFGHERANLQDLQQAVRRPTLSRQVILVPAVAFGVAASLLTSVFGYPWDGSSGIAGVFEYVSILFLVAAAALRVFGYATNICRIVTASALVMLIARVLIWAGVVPGEGQLNEGGVTTEAVTYVVLIVIGFSFVAEALSLKGVSANPPRQTQRLARAYGLMCALLSALLLAFALGLASWETTAGAGTLSDDFGAINPTPAPVIVDTTGNGDLDLAWTFVPVLHLHSEEDYPPVSVEAFLSGAEESGSRAIASAKGKSLDLETLPAACSDVDHDDCGMISCPACSSRKRDVQPEGFVAQGVFYARVVRREAQPLVLKGWNPWPGQLAALIQYWLFYGYNRWDAETIVGRLTQEHQGDWEVVSVGLDQAGKPLFVALSAHCGGQVVAWSQIAAVPGDVIGSKVVARRKRRRTEEDVSHPIVAVAKGSHANYAVSGGKRPPDWGSCKRLPSDALSALSYASNVRDLTDDTDKGWFVYPKDLSLVTRSTKPMNYPGAWGEGETITFGHRDPIKTARSPLSPPLQRASWRSPIQLYFCHSHWHGEGGGDVRLHGSPSDCG